MIPVGKAVRGLLLVAFLAACTADDAADKRAAPALQFSVAEGQAANHFIQQDGVAGHLNLRTQPAPRIVVAFPAGNSGAALFFNETDSDPVWGAVTGLQTISLADARGRRLSGLQADITINAASLALDEADVGSVRFLRKAVDYSTLPDRPAPDVHVEGNRLRFVRERLDGESSYVMDVEILAGRLLSKNGFVLAANADGDLRIRIAAASGDPLETPVQADELLAGDVVRNPTLEHALAFLTYDTKMLAGSWRFLTYFGRDTLLSTQLLMPVLTPRAAEIGLGSVLERVNAFGEVAHEEEIGELAVYRNLAERGQAQADPVYDYDMIDDNLLLAPVFARYADRFGHDRAAAFLAARASPLAKNLQLVVQQGRPFADEPVAANLIAIKEGLNDGNWRDSEEGLGGGRYPYDVNAVLMPAALNAAAEIVASGLLADEAAELPGSDELRRMAIVWEKHAARYFRVRVAVAVAVESLTAYAQEYGYPLGDVPQRDIEFSAVALDAGFEPVPVMHSDIAFDLFFLEPDEARLGQIVTRLVEQFPVGLATAVGVLAANPVHADAPLQRLVTRNHYHGTVVWSWQQAMMIAGLDRQLRREDLSPPMRELVRVARQQAWQGVTSSREIINSELWSFDVRDGEFVIAPFGQSAGHQTESNAAQLWSTVFLALQLLPY